MTRNGPTMGHLNSFSASGVGNLNFLKFEFEVVLLYSIKTVVSHLKQSFEMKDCKSVIKTEENFIVEHNVPFC